MLTAGSSKPSRHYAKCQEYSTQLMHPDYHREEWRETDRQTDIQLFPFKTLLESKSPCHSSAPHFCLLSGFSYSVQDILIQPPRRLIVRLLAIFQRRAIKPVGTGMRMIHCIQMGPFVFSELLSIVMLSKTFPFHTSSINQQLIKIIAVLIFKTNHCVYCPDQ